VQIPDGGYATTLKATVSLTKLTSFVESKGVTAEFKGSILAANVKQQILNEQNETKAISNISNVCKQMLDLSCDFSIIRGEPKQKNNDNNNWAIPITIIVKFNKNIEQFNQYLLNSIKGIAMSQDEVSQYQQLGKKTYKIASGNGNELSGEQSIYHFRLMPSVVAIIDLIYYTKHSVLNFEITNGIDTITAQEMVNDEMWDGHYWRENDKGYGFKIISDNLTPIFNSKCNQGHSTSNGPNGIFLQQLYGGVYCGKERSVVDLYEPIVDYNGNFYYNGGRNMIFEDVYNTKYGFLTQADSDLPADIIGKKYDKSNNGYQAVISLFDFKTDITKVITFYYEDILSLTDIEKVQEYKIIPISKN